MATNFEYYKEVILKITSKNKVFGLKEGKIVECEDIGYCSGCGFCGGCENNRYNWLYAEHIEPPKLTKRERAFCELVQEGYIARDKSQSLCWFPADVEIEKGERIWHGKKFLNISAIKLSFNFIAWEDEKPWAVEDLLKLEVIEEVQ